MAAAPEDNGFFESRGGMLAAEDDASRQRMIARLDLLWKQRRWLWRGGAAGFVLALALAFLLPNRYEASALLMPPDHEGGSALTLLAAMSGSSSLGSLAGNLLGVNSTGALFVGILQSRTIKDRLIEQFGLREVYGVRRMEDARRILARRTEVSEDRKSGILTIAVADGNAQRAADLAAGYIRELDRLVVELTTSAAHRERVFLEERLGKVKEELDSAAKEFSEFASRNTALNIQEQAKAMVEAAATLQGQLIAAQTELEGLRQIYTDSNVRVRAGRARIAELRDQLERFGGEDGAQGAHGKTNGSIYPTIRELPLLGVTYADLYRRTKIQETVFELLTQQYELAKVQEAKETPSVKVLDAPAVPEKKSFPPRLLIVVLGMVSGLVATATGIVGKAKWEQLVPTDPGRQLTLEIMGTLRRAAQAAGNLRLRRNSRKGWKGTEAKQQHNGSDERDVNPRQQEEET
ncbi:MAG TPA: Wzz/FepE/Etk N-terminal domain-containing protein [Terriglobia bacterium]|nr:Wzz/FepE/Etk N-terminal domain-containing protein [Terriglobia bacterium]